VCNAVVVGGGGEPRGGCVEINQGRARLLPEKRERGGGVSRATTKTKRKKMLDSGRDKGQRREGSKEYID